MMKENIIAKLTLKDDKYACALADKIISESQETDEWYEYFDAIISDFLTHIHIKITYIHSEYSCKI